MRIIKKEKHTNKVVGSYFVDVIFPDMLYTNPTVSLISITYPPLVCQLTNFTKNNNCF